MVPKKATKTTKTTLEKRGRFCQKVNFLHFLVYRSNRFDLMKACKFGNSPKVSNYDSKFKNPKIGQDRPKFGIFSKKIPILAGKNRKNYSFLKSFGECPGVNIGLETCFFGFLGPVFIIFDHLIPPHGL